MSRAALAALALALACNGGGGSTDASGGSNSGASTDPSSTTDTTATSSTTTASTSTTDDTGASTSAATATTSTSAATTGSEICHIGGTGESGGAPGPWLELLHHDLPVIDGLVLSIECGFQGYYMLALVPYFGGFNPDGVFVSLSVVMDVPGHNTNPDGHFFSDDDLQFYIGCAIPDGSDPCIIAILPPDDITDVTTLNGLTGTLSVTLHPDGGGPDVQVGADVLIASIPDASWRFCGGVP